VKTSQFWQREHMGVSIQSANNNDLILVSDVDEIPKASVLPEVSKVCNFTKVVVFFSQAWYLLFLDVRVIHSERKIFAYNRQFKNPNNDKWLGTYACTAWSLRNLYRGNVNFIWSLKWNNYRFNHLIVEDSGWHFSYMGGLKGLLRKVHSNGIKAYARKHVEDLCKGKFIGSLLSIEVIGDSHPAEIREHPESYNNLLIHHNDFAELSSRLENFLDQNETQVYLSYFRR
jgi:beta-1,4-mannosyl-glycoprotein beta-1,4-N-acetylglucosaminyltransferase